MFATLEPTIQAWWLEAFGAFVPENEGFFTPPQRGAIPHIAEGTNTLICAPTGSGKTLASFTAIIDSLYRKSRCESPTAESTDGGLENSGYCLYVSPLQSLTNDIYRNLERPLADVRPEQEGKTILRRAFPYREYDEDHWESLL